MAVTPEDGGVGQRYRGQKEPTGEFNPPTSGTDLNSDRAAMLERQRAERQRQAEQGDQYNNG